ncbi:MAG: Gfo/Idh/MocA family oxidoreductase [Limosilactobacillus sp.]|uniref:Gfo/Idh/MocA family protein n=1 Tax=Limosilactobacillus sp. TaxID=2773925 RepID=UPI0026FBBBB9|nr:Gfo/Idh/MocA family oxidoreductase [Limosilactobacillus sp.]
MLKLGVIGTHIITDQMLDAAKTTGKYELTAVYSRTMERAKEFGQPYGATEFYDDLDTFFAEGDFDVVYVASPNSCHYEQVRKAIENDKFIILEKPAFVNPSQFSAIESLLAAHPKARLVEAARHIHTPIFEKGLEKVEEMKKDHIQGATITVMKYSSRYDNVLADQKPYPNIFTLDFAGGALMDLGVYAVYGAVTFFGEPDTVVYYPTIAKSGVDAKGVAILNYDKFTVTLNFGKTANSHLDSEVYGLKDTLVFDSIFETQKVTYYDADKTAHPFDVPVEKNSMTDEMNDFAALFTNPDDPAQVKKYQRWMDLSRTVNSVMYSLRQSANLTFPADND